LLKLNFEILGNRDFGNMQSGPVLLLLRRMPLLYKSIGMVRVFPLAAV
jgi:hypothetical protein